MALSLLVTTCAAVAQAHRRTPGQENTNVTITFHQRFALVALALGCYTATPVIAQEARPDNTRVNARDRQASEATADQQKNDRSDVELTRQIRKSLIADKSLSTYAHNLKVITQDGKVTLKGPVATVEEKALVEEKAGAVAGQANVISEVSVSTASSTKRKAQEKAGQ
jgi:hyperosmotically inducible protein